MDQFTYTDIFDTKGIEYLIVIAFLLLIIPFWIMLNRPVRLKTRLIETAGALTAGILRIPRGLFFSRNHTWSQLEGSGLARIGMDDLLLHLTGGVEVGFLQSQGEKVSRGDVVARIIQGNKELKITSPISGEIEQVNTGLGESPGVVNEDPYGSWLYRIRPDKWQEETSKSYLAGEASQWMEGELSRFKDFLAGALAGGDTPASEPVLQEGGELVDFPLSGMEQKVWSAFQAKFLDRRE